MFSSPQGNERTTLKKKTFIILSLPCMQRGVHWRISINTKSYHLISFELVNPLLHVYFPSFGYRIFFERSEVYDAVVCCVVFRNLAISEVTKSHSKD